MLKFLLVVQRVFGYSETKRFSLIFEARKVNWIFKNTKHRRKINYKINFFFLRYMNIFIYFTIIRCFRFNFVIFSAFANVNCLCSIVFIRPNFNVTYFKDASNSRNINMLKVSCVLHYKCVFSPKFNELSRFFPVVFILIIL